MAAALVVALGATVMITFGSAGRQGPTRASAAAEVKPVPPTTRPATSPAAPTSGADAAVSPSGGSAPTATSTRTSAARPATSPAPVRTTVPAAPAAATAAPPAAPQVHSLTVIGDSWTYGQGATNLRGYAVLAAEQLGWQYHGLGVWGSGYTQVGGGSTFDQRVDAAAATHPDVLVVEGSLNERNTPVDTLAAAANATLAHLRAQADPTTRILILGATYSPGTPNATIDSINATIRQAAARSGLQFLDPAAANWIDAGNAALWHDPDHPNDAGHQVVASRFESVLRTLVSG